MDLSRACILLLPETKIRISSNVRSFPWLLPPLRPTGRSIGIIRPTGRKVKLYITNKTIKSQKI